MLKLIGSYLPVLAFIAGEVLIAIGYLFAVIGEPRYPYETTLAMNLALFGVLSAFAFGGALIFYLAGPSYSKAGLLVGLLVFQIAAIAITFSVSAHLHKTIGVKIDAERASAHKYLEEAITLLKGQNRGAVIDWFERNQKSPLKIRVADHVDVFANQDSFSAQNPLYLEALELEARSIQSRSDLNFEKWLNFRDHIGRQDTRAIPAYLLALAKYGSKTQQAQFADLGWACYWLYTPEILKAIVKSGLSRPINQLDQHRATALSTLIIKLWWRVSERDERPVSPDEASRALQDAETLIALGADPKLGKVGMVEGNVDQRALPKLVRDIEDAKNNFPPAERTAWERLFPKLQ